jgi:hypothetical protein
MYNDGYSRKKDYEEIWAIAERFVRGADIDDEYIKLIDKRMKLGHFFDDIDLYGYTHETNLILRLVRSALAIICDNLASVEAIPATSEEEDIMAAQLATDFLRSRETIDNEQMLRQNEVFSLLVYGEVMRYTRYNPDLRNRYGNNGDIETIAIDPSQYVRSTTDNDSSQPEWVCLSEVYDVDILRDMFPGKQIDKQVVTIEKYGHQRLEHKVLSEDKCIVHRMFIRESKENPKGLYFAWVGDTLLQQNDTLPDGIFPFTVYQWIHQTGYAYPMGFVEPLIKPQITINRELAKIKAVSNKIINPPMIVDSMAEDELVQAKLPNGQEIVYLPPGQRDVRFVEYRNNVNLSFSIIEQAERNMYELAGIREPSVANAKTATAVALQNETDAQGLQYFRTRIEKANENNGRIKLVIAQQKFKSKRMIAITGIDNQTKVSYFYGADLAHAVDVQVRSTPYMTEATKNQILTNLIQAGAFSAWQSLEDGYSKMSLIDNSGLPNRRDIIRAQLGEDLDYQSLAKYVCEVRALKTKLELANMELAYKQVELQSQQMDAQGQQIALQQQAMAEGAAQGAEQPSLPGQTGGQPDQMMQGAF